LGDIETGRPRVGDGSHRPRQRPWWKTITGPQERTPFKAALWDTLCRERALSCAPAKLNPAIAYFNHRGRWALYQGEGSPNGDSAIFAFRYVGILVRGSRVDLVSQSSLARFPNFGIHRALAHISCMLRPS
jgi:hypothetical protein